MTEGETVCLILMMMTERISRMKPQNLLTGLPVRSLGSGT